MLLTPPREPKIAEWMVLAIFRDGLEQCICVGTSEKEAMLHFVGQRDELLEDHWFNKNIAFFTLRRWNYAQKQGWGGWWRLILTWRATRRAA